jgi:hypothetical protein
MDNFPHETNCTNWSTDFSTASVSAFFVLPHTWCKLKPCCDFSLCSHPWHYSHLCWGRYSSSQKIFACVIMYLKIGTWSSPVTYKLLYNSLTSLTTCSFLHCLTNSQTFLTSPNCINLQDFFLCSSISYTVDDPTLWVLHTLCTDVLLSWLCSIYTIFCMENTGCCLQAPFSWVIFRSKHCKKLILAQNSEI